VVALSGDGTANSAGIRAASHLAMAEGAVRRGAWSMVRSGPPLPPFQGPSLKGARQKVARCCWQFIKCECADSGLAMGRDFWGLCAWRPPTPYFRRSRGRHLGDSAQ